MLAHIWKGSLADGRIFEMQLDEHQQQQLWQSMQNYCLSVWAFACVWYLGLSDLSLGLLGLCGWASAFLTFGDDSTEEARDALYHLGATWVQGEAVEPFAFSRGNKLYWALLVKVAVQSAYMCLVFLFYEALRFQSSQAQPSQLIEEGQEALDYFNAEGQGASRPTWGRQDESLPSPPKQPGFGEFLAKCRAAIPKEQLCSLLEAHFVSQIKAIFYRKFSPILGTPLPVLAPNAGRQSAGVERDLLPSPEMSARPLGHRRGPLPNRLFATPELAAVVLLPPAGERREGAARCCW